MAIPNFFSVERTGYTKISDLFTDVMKDMIENGFTLVNASNGFPMTSWKTTVVTGGTGQAVGNKLYINDGSRPIYQGSPRPSPYVEVTKVSTIGSSSGVVTGLSEVKADYDFPIWQTPPTNPVNLYATASSTTPLTVTANLANTAVTYSSVGFPDNAPVYFSFTLEASGDVDPLNESRPAPTHPFVDEVKRQPWRVQFVVADEQKVSGSIATPLQMRYDDAAGKVIISRITDDFGVVIDNVGAIGAAQPGGIFTDSDLNQGLYNRKIRVAQEEKTFPLTYILSITDRGFFLGIYEGSWSTIRAATTVNSNYFNWVLCQRPVDRGTGVTLTRGKAPVFHINSVNYKYYKSVVREADILHPTSGPSPTPASGNINIASSAVSGNTPSSWVVTGTPDTRTGEASQFLVNLEPGSTLYDTTGYTIGTVKSIVNDASLLLTSKPGKIITNQDFFYTPPNILALRVLADVHSPDSHAIFNAAEQIALTEDKTYLLSFPHNLTTPRFRYTEELDMVGMTSSDVVMAGQDIQFTTYGEWGPRTYRALPANAALNTGLRLAVIWKPMGPKWISPNEGSLGEISAGDTIDVDFIAEEAPVPAGETPRADPTFEIVRGSIPKGLVFYTSGKVAGTVELSEYTEATMIKFTVAAKHIEEGVHAGYALRDFWFTYVPA
jgi:hypothetical protein